MGVKVTVSKPDSRCIENELIRTHFRRKSL